MSFISYLRLVSLALGMAFVLTPAVAAGGKNSAPDSSPVARAPQKNDAAARITEALDNLQKARSLRFSEREVMRHGDKIIAQVETKGEWLVGKALKVVETVWMGEDAFTTTTIVINGMSYVQSEGDATWTADKAKPEELVPQVVAELPLYLNPADGYRKGDATWVRDVACRAYEYKPLLPPVLGITPDTATGRVLVSSKNQVIAEVSIEAEGKDASGDPLRFSFSVSFFDHNAPMDIRPPVANP